MSDEELRALFDAWFIVQNEKCYGQLNADLMFKFWLAGYRVGLTQDK